MRQCAAAYCGLAILNAAGDAEPRTSLLQDAVQHYQPMIVTVQGLEQTCSFRFFLEDILNPTVTL